MIRHMDKDIIDELQDDWIRQRPDLDPEPMGAVLRIQALAKLFNDLASEKLQKYQLHWWQYDVLSALRRQGKPFTMAATELADAGMLTSGAMTNRIDRLEQSALVRRLKDDADRRRVLVQLTEKGLGLIESATEARFEAATTSLRGLHERPRIQLSDLLRLALLAQEG